MHKWIVRVGRSVDSRDETAIILTWLSASRPNLNPSLVFFKYMQIVFSLKHFPHPTLTTKCLERNTSACGGQNSMLPLVLLLVQVLHYICQIYAAPNLDANTPKDFLLFGYDQGVMGGLLTLKSFVKVFPQMDTSSNLPAATRTRNAEIQGNILYINIFL